MLPPPMAHAPVSRALADLPVVSPDEPSALRLSGVGSEPVVWAAIDGGKIERVTLGDEEVTAFTATEPGTYRVVGSSASFSTGDTTSITVVSAAVTASIAKLVMRPENASVQPNDTLRYVVWGLTASGDSVPAAAKLHPSRGYIRGMNYYCPIEGEFMMTAALPGTSIRKTTDVTVSRSAPDEPPPPASSVGGTLARIEMTPTRDTIPPNDTLTFTVRGISTTGSTMPVSVRLYPDRGYVRGLSYYTPIEGTFRIRAVQLDGGLSAAAYITVKRGAPPVDDETGTPTDPAPEPTPDPTPDPEPEPDPDPDTTPIPPAEGVAELPRVLLDSRYVAPTGRTIRVSAASSLQAAIDGAQRGDVILLASGATYHGNFKLPPKPGTGWVTIRTEGALPPEGTRVTPSTAAGFATLSSPNSMPALWTATSGQTSQYRILGVEIKSSADMNYNLVNLGDYSRTSSSVSDLPQHIILDRVYVHGAPSHDVRRCVALNGRSMSVVNSWLSDCHYRMMDAQAIAGWEGPGPFKIVNNHLEGGSENVMFGGADPRLTGVTPADIEIRGNHFYKPLSWKGDGWAIKNLLELKHAKRVLVEGNILENNWYEAQTGFAIVLKSSNQSGRCTWCVVRDITIRFNHLINSPGGINIAAYEAPKGGGAVPASRIAILHNLFDRVGLLTQPGSHRILQLVGALQYVQFEHNTALPESHIVVFDGAPAASSNYSFRNNVLRRGRYGVFGSGHGEGNGALAYYARGAAFVRNAIIGAPEAIYPAGNYYPASLAEAGLLNVAAGDYRITTGPLRTAATDGTMLGVDIAQLERMTAGVR